MNNANQSTKKQSIVILVISLCLLSMSLSEGIDVMSHTSHHDEFMSDKSVQYVDTRSRLLASTYEFRNFRIAIDWTLNDAWLLKQSSSIQAALRPKVWYMKNILNTVKFYFQDRFQVNSQNTMTLPNTTCHGATVKDKFLGKPIEKDLVIVIKPHNESSSWFAAAGSCIADSSTGRPVMGAVYLNYQHINVSEVNKYYLPGVFIHELMHVLGFSGHYMERKGLVKEIQHGNTKRMAIVSERVVNYAREYFGCPELEGVPLENGGGGGSAGSHWEKTMFPAEVMNPQVSSPMKISELTIMLMEDLGWYKGVNAHEDYTYLKGDGCHTIKGGECNANKSDEFCAAADWNKNHCYPNKLGKGFCGNSSTFMGSCGLVMPASNALCTVENSSNRKTFNFESYGAHSRCAMASTSNDSNMNAACLRMRCTADKVEMQFGDEVYTCQGSGPQSVSTTAFSGRINCPAFSEMCTEVLDKRCPMDCYGQGYCMGDGTCQCLAGFSGDDCNHGLPKEQDIFVTDFDIRKVGEDNNDEETDDDEERQDEEDQENDDEQDQNDDDEEEKEEEEDEEEPISQKAKNLKAKIIRALHNKSTWMLSSKKHSYKQESYALCATGETKWNKRCAKKEGKASTKSKKTYEKSETWNVEAGQQNLKLAAEITSTQFEKIKQELADLEVVRSDEFKAKWLVYLEEHKAKASNNAEQWGQFASHLSQLIEMYQNNPMMEDYVKKLWAMVEQYNNYQNYYREVQHLTEKKISEANAVNDGFNNVESEIESEIAQEMEAEINNTSSTGSGAEIAQVMTKN